MVALKYAVMMNGVTQLIMMKADVLNDFPTLKVAVAYRVNGKETTELPFETNDEIVPVYREFKGWQCNINDVRTYDEFPAELKAYIEFIEQETGSPRQDRLRRPRSGSHRSALSHLPEVFTPTDRPWRSVSLNSLPFCFFPSKKRFWIFKKKLNFVKICDFRAETPLPTQIDNNRRNDLERLVSPPPTYEVITPKIHNQ